eukprot:scaffold98767_cov32-Tisochrysis_lutea.AAC.2
MLNPPIRPARLPAPRRRQRSEDGPPVPHAPIAAGSPALIAGGATIHPYVAHRSCASPMMRAISRFASDTKSGVTRVTSCAAHSARSHLGCAPGVRDRMASARMPPTSFTACIIRRVARCATSPAQLVTGCKCAFSPLKMKPVAFGSRRAFCSGSTSSLQIAAPWPSSCSRRAAMAPQLYSSSIVATNGRWAMATRTRVGTPSSRSVPSTMSWVAPPPRLMALESVWLGMPPCGRSISTS